MSQMTQVTIDAMYGEQAALENQLAAVINNVPRDVVEQQKVEALIQDKKTEIQAAEKELREQGKQTTVDNYVDTLSQIFEALFPSDIFRPVFGINEYEGKRAQFYQLNQAYVGETVDELHKQNEQALALKDEKIKLLNDQSLVVQKQLDTANVTLEQKHQDYVDAETAADKLRNELRAEQQKHEEESARTAQLTGALNDQIAELEAKLTAAQQPKEESKPSQKLTDMLTSIKSINETSADEMLARFNARQKSEETKVQVPEVPQVTPFHDATATGTTSDTVPTATTDAPVEGNQFPVTPAAIVQSPEVPSASAQLAMEPSSSEGQSGEAKVTASQLEERLTQFAAEHGLVKAQVA